MIEENTIQFDPDNFNKHTDEGMEMLEESVRQFKAIESIALDADNRIVTGGARKEIFDKLGMKPKFVKLKDDEYIAIQTDLSGEERVRAAIVANTIAQKNINLDLTKIQEVAVEEYNIDVEELGVSILNFEGNIDDFFEENNKPESEKEILCPHCGKNVNEKI